MAMINTGRHHEINHITKKSHPNIEVIGPLKRGQSAVEGKLQPLDGHWRPPAQKQKYRNIDARIRSLKDELISHHITNMEYSDHIGELLHFNRKLRL